MNLPINCPNNKGYHLMSGSGRPELTWRGERPWVNLSAKHGLVGPEEVIEPYEKTLKRMPVKDQCQWADQVLRKLTPHLREGFDPLPGRRGLPEVPCTRRGTSRIRGSRSHGGLRPREQLVWIIMATPCLIVSPIQFVSTNCSTALSGVSAVPGLWRSATVGWTGRIAESFSSLNPAKNGPDRAGVTGSCSSARTQSGLERRARCGKG